MVKNKVLGALVSNAFGFLRKAISDLESDPKFSIIHFHAAVELFLKARLMMEHWSLVVTKTDQADLKKFISGDFHSVSLQGAASRLDKVVDSGLSQSELAAFNTIGKHRNRLVHFYHEAESKDVKIKSIVKELLIAWYFLHELLIKTWQSHFNKWESEIDQINSELRGLNTYLEVVYQQIEPTKRDIESMGSFFEFCPSCQYEAQQHENILNSPYDASCLVCGLKERALQIDCTECGKKVVFNDEGEGDCQHCGNPFDCENLKEILEDSGAAIQAAQDGDYDQYATGNCNFCDYRDSIVLTEKSEYVCSQCLYSFETLTSCDSCGEPYSGEVENSMAFGCGFCEGRMGHHYFE